MEEYPLTLMEFEKQFSSEEACRDYLYKLRWPNGFVCTRCKNTKAWPIGNTLYQCTKCLYRTSVIAGTIFQDTHSPLTIWFRAIWWVTSQKNGASALGLQRILGLRSYQTAWAWLHKLRRAMIRPGRDRLSGIVEVDETYLGGLEEGKRGRKVDKKALIAVAAQKKGNNLGRIRMKQIYDASSDSLHQFIEKSIEPGSIVHTDGWRGYSGLEDKGYIHDVTVITKRKESVSELLPYVHKSVSLLKRWLLGTHQGAISHKHLDYYLDEFVFRFNRRTSEYRGKLFYRLIQQAMLTEPKTYNNIINKPKKA